MIAIVLPNEIGIHPGWTALMEFVGKSKTLERLCLSANSLEARHMESLAAALAINSSLRFLAVVANPSNESF
jgi:hypothetical protein